jgi:hypothetical protein
MYTFAFEKLDEVKTGKLTFYKILIDGICLYDKFCRESVMNLKVMSLEFMLLKKTSTSL